MTSKKIGAALVLVAVCVGLAWWRYGARKPAAPADVHAARAAAAPLTVNTRGELVVPDPEGGLRLEGQVVDADGQPAGDAKVTIDTVPARTLAVESDGSFAFEKLLGKRYTLVATAPGRVAGPVIVKLGDAVGPVILKTHAAATIGVMVVDAETGKPLEGATVEARGLTHAAATTAAGGDTELAPVVPGYLAIVVSKAGFASAFEGIVASASAPSKLTVALRKGATAKGRVVDATGKGVANAVVWFDSTSDYLTGSDPARDGARTDATGAFQLLALARGSYVLHASGEADGGTGDLPVQLDADLADLVIKLEPVVAASGKVTTSSGKPAPGATVHAIWEGGDRSVAAADDGTYNLRGLPKLGVWLTASDGTASSKPRKVDLATASGHVDLVLDNEAVIAGTVVDENGDPIEGARVLGARTDALDAGANAATAIEDTTDSSGRFTLKGLVAGQYALAAARDAQHPAGERTSVATGTQDVVLKVAALGKIKGRVAFKTGAAPSTYRVRVGRTGIPTTFSAAAFEVESKSGTVSLWIDGPGFTGTASDPVVITGGEVADAGTIQLDRGRAVQGRVKLSDGLSLVGGEVVIGALLSGTGQRVDAGEGGPSFRSDVKRGAIHPDGTFRIEGVSTSDVSVVASLPSGARSSPAAVAAGADDATNVELEISRPTGLSGVVSRAGKPTRSIVNAQAQSSPLTMFTVMAGPDGSFHFDQLAPGNYVVAAIIGSPMAGSPFYPHAATLGAGGGAVLNIDATPGDSTLALHVADPTPGIAFVTTRPGAATNALALLGELAGQSDGQWAFAPVIGGNAAFSELARGTGRVCFVKLTSKVQPTTGAIIELIARNGAAMPASCAPVTLAPGAKVELGAGS